MEYGAIIGVAAVVLVVLCAVVVRIRSNRLASERLQEIIPEIEECYAELERLSDFGSGYLMKKDWEAFRESAVPLYRKFSTIPKNVIADSAVSGKTVLIAERLNDPSFRDGRNERYKAHELKHCAVMFSNIDGGKSLDSQQRDAIVTDEYSNLVIAGAGSGKTSVVVGKVKYLVERWGIKPEEILVTSFTRASVDDLRSRIEASGVEGVAARTFHSIGLRVLGSEVAIANENELEKHVNSYLSGKLSESPDQAAAFIEFFGLRVLASLENMDSDTADEKMKFLKASDMRSLKGLVEEMRLQGDMETIRGERVHSLEELMIANFLFLNGVEYEYEKPYTGDIPEELREENRRAYQPDFFLPEYDIWFEHFGVDEHGHVPWMQTAVEEQSYLDGMDWKRRVHAACGTRLIESYSYWSKDHDLLNRVEQLLVSNGVVLNNDPVRNAAICGNLLQDKRFFSSMAQLLTTFISLVKANNKSAFEVDDAAREAYKGDGAMWRRYELFTRFAWPIFDSYQDSLNKGPIPKIDFDDMINKAAEKIRQEGYPGFYRYIIVDEYQDISLSRFGLLSAIRDTMGAKLMCVGDDWQAIYRFAGSDVTLFTNFGNLVGDYEELRIEHTYRNSQELVDAASGFVLKNPCQLKKAVISQVPSPHRPPIAIYSSSNQQSAFLFALEDLLSLPDGGGEIKVLGRNGHDLERIFPGFAPTKKLSFRNPRRGDESEKKFSKVIEYKEDGKKVSKEIGFMTVHKSKGLQADNVIVIGLLNENYGFPNMIVDDPIIELLLADSDNYVFAEERRLFYVALTRTKNKVWLVTGSELGNPGISLFVSELFADSGERSVELFSPEAKAASIRCPRCGGALVKRKAENGSEFVGCSNYPFCDKTYSDTRILEDKKKCPECGGWLTRRRRSSDGKVFFGCTNYPNYCDYTMDLDGSNGKTRQQWKAAKLPARKMPKCPRCGAAMVLRNGSYGAFYGCSKYPACKGTRKA